MLKDQFPVVRLKPKKDRSLLRRHPWVFSGAIASTSSKPDEGDVVMVESNSGQFLGMGHFANGSIAVRILSFEPALVDQTFWDEKIVAAFELRKRIGLAEDTKTNMYRLVHGEGDGLPGLIIDWYNGVAVIQAHSMGMYYALDQIVSALKYTFKKRLKAVYNKSAETIGKIGGSVENGYVFGAESEERTAMEYGINFSVDWHSGQKTGFFIDQRENRKLVEQYSADRMVLNCFCYTGGFSLYALRSGAKYVHSLDSSAGALRLLEDNLKLNDFGSSEHKNIQADAVEYLQDLKDSYNLIILDPPAFAKHIRAKHKAVQGYRRINEAAIKAIEPGGILFTFSCSQAVDKELFKNTVMAAAIAAGRKVIILHQLHQPPDHPVSIYHPEGEYLKGLVLLIG